MTLYIKHCKGKFGSTHLCIVHLNNTTVVTAVAVIFYGSQSDIFTNALNKLIPASVIRHDPEPDPFLAKPYNMWV
jgi:hypothetical protein